MTPLPPLGLWIDCPPQRVLRPEYWDRLAELGVTTAALMIDRMTAAWDPFWSATELEAAAQLAIERDLELVLTTWPSPRLADIDAMCDEMAALLLCGAVAWEIDTEGLWRGKHVRGFHSLQEAGQYLIDRMRRIAVPADVRLELTTHPGHKEAGAHAMLTPHVDRFMVQAYSVRLRLGKHVSWSHRHGPGSMQRTALKKAATIPEVPKVGVGLAAWSQAGWPGRTVDEAMGTALEAALEHDPCEVRMWSSKWVMKDATVAGFLAKHWGICS